MDFSITGWLSIILPILVLTIAILCAKYMDDYDDRDVTIILLLGSLVILPILSFSQERNITEIIIPKSNYTYIKTPNNLVISYKERDFLFNDIYNYVNIEKKDFVKITSVDGYGIKNSDRYIIK